MRIPNIVNIQHMGRSLYGQERWAPKCWNVASFPYSHHYSSSWVPPLNFRAQEPRFEINDQNQFTSYVNVYLYIGITCSGSFSMKQFSQPKWRRLFHLPLLLADFLLLNTMITPSHNASHLTFLSPSHSQCWAKRGQPSPWPWLTLTQLHIHVKMIWDFTHQTDGQRCATSLSGSQGC